MRSLRIYGRGSFRNLPIFEVDGFGLKSQLEDLVSSDDYATSRLAILDWNRVPKIRYIFRRPRSLLLSEF